MVKFYQGVENQPIFMVVNEIEVPQERSGISKSILQKILNFIRFVNEKSILNLIKLFQM